MEYYRNPAKICSRIGVAVLVLMATWLAGASILSLILTVAAPELVTGTSWMMWVINDVPLYCVALPVFLAILSTIPDGPREARPAPLRLNLWKYLLILAFCIGATYMVSMLTDVVKDAVTFWQPLIPADMLDSLIGGSNPLENLIFLACVPALGEEFIFRYTLRKKLRGAGDKIYIFFSALCFGMFHANFSQIFFAFVVGAIFAWLYLQTNNIWLPISLHFFINLLGSFLPQITATPAGETAFYAVIVALAVYAIVLFLVFLRRVREGLQPPCEPGWPYKAPKNDSRTPWVRPAPDAKALPAGQPVPQIAARPAPRPPHSGSPWQGAAQPMVPPAAGHRPGGYPVPVIPQTPPNTWPPPNVWPPQNTHPYAQPQYTNSYMGPQYIPEYHSKPRGAISLCLGNPGMIIFLAITGIMSLFTMVLL